MRLTPCLLALSLMLTAEAKAYADKAECAPAFEQAQRLRQAYRLVEARAALLVCVQEECPSFIKKDCGQWLPEVEHDIPSLSVRVLDRDGCDRPDVAITLDGEPMPGAGGGASLDVDPGTHELLAELDGRKLVQQVVVARGERNRVVALSVGTATTCAKAAPAGPPAPAPILEAPRARPVPVLSYILGGVAVGGLAVGGVFGAAGWSQRGELDDCRGSCRRRDIDVAQRSFLVSDIGFGVGIVALAAAIVVYLRR